MSQLPIPLPQVPRLLRSTFSASLFAAVVSLSGCMSQNQAEVDQLRAQLKAAQDEVAALKAQQQAAAAAAPIAAPVQPEPVAAAPVDPPPAAPAAPPFEQAQQTFDSEKRDKEWAFKRENGLLQAAKSHIAEYGATLNSVACKTTACSVIVDVPEKAKKPYEPMTNVWAETTMSSGQKAIHNKKTRWTYLLQRHAKDYPTFGEQRVDPLALAKQSAGPAAAAPATPAAPPVAAAPAKPPAAPAASPVAAAPAKPTPAPATPAAKPAAAPVPAAPAAPPASATPASAPPAPAAPAHTGAH